MSQNEDDDLNRLEEACNTLAEFFDTVQIFATRLELEGEDRGCTTNASWGTGNWFARKGQVDAWVLKQNEISRREVKDQE